jgi:hypothetical protein
MEYNLKLKIHPMRRRASNQQQSQEEKGKQSFRRRRTSHQELNQEEKGKPGASHNSPASRSSLHQDFICKSLATGG